MNRENKPADDKLQAIVDSINRAKAQCLECAAALKEMEQQKVDFKTDLVLSAVRLQAVEVMRRFNRGELSEEQFFTEVLTAIAAHERDN